MEPGEEGCVTEKIMFSGWAYIRVLSRGGVAAMLLSVSYWRNYCACGAPCPGEDFRWDN